METVKTGEEQFWEYMEKYHFLSNYNNNNRELIEVLCKEMGIDKYIHFCDYTISMKSQHLKQCFAVFTSDEYAGGYLTEAYHLAMTTYRDQLEAEGVPRGEMLREMYIGCEYDYWPEKYH